uniref:TolC family protein n=1 Tax=Candidatus Cryptobacteroides bacterium TaxID=3085639 RepID=UPI004028D3E0
MKMRTMATESAVAVFLSMLLTASPQALACSIDNNPQRQEPAGATSDTLRLTLTDVFTRIENENKTMSMLRTAQEATEEGIKSAKNARYPEINAELNVSYIGDSFLTDRNFSNYTKAPSPHFGNGFTLEAQQVIYAGGAVNAAVKMAEHEGHMSEAVISKSRQGLRLMAAGEYLDLFRTDNSIKVYKENIALTTKLIEEINARREQGLALAADVTRYELRLEMLKLDLVRLQNTREIMNYRLVNSLGLPEGTVISSILGDDEDMRDRSRQNWQEIAADASPEMKVSGIKADMALTRQKLVRSERLPKIAVVAYENFNGPITFEIPPIDKNLNIWYVGLGIRYNFSSLYKSGHKLKQAAIEVRQAEQAKNITEENLRNDVQKAYADYMQSYVELETSEKSLQLADENYERIHDRYMEQLVLVTDMLDAFNMKLDAELGVSAANAEIQYRLCCLRYAAGIL